MSSLSAEQQAYEFPEIWEPEWFPPEDQARISALAALVPSSVASLLDVGCGNGLFVNHMVELARPGLDRIVGIDRSNVALTHVRTEKYAGSADSVPFAGQEFDLVTCHEVLEHLPVSVFPKALDELSRVAKRWIMISVPYAQDLDKSLCRCPTCRARFNPDFHVRSFDEATMDGLFATRGFGPIEQHRLGKSEHRYDHELRNGIWQKLFHKAEEPGFPPFAICPVCGHTEPDALKSELNRRKRAHASEAAHSTAHMAGNGLRGRLAAIMPTFARYRWIVTVYERNS